MNNLINLLDLRTAFAYKSSKELRFTWLVYYMISKPAFVKMLKGLTTIVLKYHLPFKALIKKTVFKIFCAGENETEAFETIQKLHRFNVKSVLDYVSEAEKSDRAFDANTTKIIENIRMSATDGTRCDFISIKLSGIANPDDLTSLSESGQYFSDSRYLTILSRLKKIVAAASENNIMVYIDSEESWMQNAIDQLAEDMMSMFNREKVIVFNTLQMYRTDRIEYLKNMIQWAIKMGYKVGVKLVRGAYHEKEIHTAQMLEKPIPVFMSKAQTDQSFNRAIDICFAQHEHVCTCIATHNENSIRYALVAIDRHEIKDHTNTVQFSQLLGMSDHITFNLADKGFNVSKYLPYGEVEKAIPYLMRRADENTSVNGQMTREFGLLSKELKRRKAYYA